MKQPSTPGIGALGALVLTLGVGGCPRPDPAGPHRASPAKLPRPTSWRSVSAGIDHTCAIAQDRSLWCWGANRWGQLGDATLTDRDRPTRVRDIRGAALIAAGYRRTFALTTNGELWGWGTVKTGNLPRAELLRYARPRRVNIPEPVQDYRIGRASCARTRNGNLWCWRGQWDGATPNPAATPKRLAGLPKIMDFDSGVNHFCAVDDHRRVWCWGQNAQGQLGDGTRRGSAHPVRIKGLPAAAGVVCGSDTSCVFTRQGAVWCWGGLGRPNPAATQNSPPGAPGPFVGPTPTSVLRPKPLEGVRDVISLVLGSPATWARTRDGRILKWETAGAHTAARQLVKAAGHAAGLRFGSEHRCVLDRRGKVRCWGDNAKGQLGDASFRSRATPTLVTGIPRLNELSVGAYHACGLSHRGQIWCWGDDGAGQLGLGAPTRWRTPARAPPTLRGALHGAAGHHHACAIRSGGEVWCWGRPTVTGRSGVLAQDRLTPRRVAGIADAASLASYGSATCALKHDTTVWCWGEGTHGILGRLGIHDPAPEPQPVHGLRGATRISMGADHACAIKRDRTVWCWGGRFHRRRRSDLPGAPDRRAAPPPTQWVFGEAVALDTGGHHTCAIRQDKTVWCWGDNIVDNRGNSAPTSPGRPVQIKGLSGAGSIAAGQGHTCAVTADGRVWCWGDNRRGQLGAATPSRSATPRAVPGVARVTAVYAGPHHTCARTGMGTLWCWGERASVRRRGHNFSPPTLVPGLRDVKHAWLGLRFTCALDSRGTVRCWGDNPSGQLGRKPSPYRSRPVLIGAK